MSAYDIRGGFNWIGDIDKGLHRTLGSAAIGQTLCKFVERDEVTDIKKTFQKTFYSGAFDKKDVTSIRVFSLKSPNIIQLQLVEIKDSKLSS